MYWFDKKTDKEGSRDSGRDCGGDGGGDGSSGDVVVVLFTNKIVASPKPNPAEPYPRP